MLALVCSVPVLSLLLLVLALARVAKLSARHDDGPLIAVWGGQLPPGAIPELYAGRARATATLPVVHVGLDEAGALSPWLRSSSRGGPSS